jgi:phosphotriesterase-related protein
MTVTGPIEPAEMGRTLSHEHVMVDFVGVDAVGPDRYDRAAVVETVRPYLEEAVAGGVQTFVDCTPAYLGRDPVVLRRLARSTGLRILTNTGYYGARDDQHLPEHAYGDSVDALAARWVDEWTDGIGDTGVRPGFLKIGVDAGALSDVDRKLVRAAARAHLETGLTIAVHTGPARPARQQLDVLADEGVSPSAWIWVHAQAAEDPARHVEVARRGGWVSLDGYAPDRTERYVRLVARMRERDLLDRVLLSQDNGWYSVGEPGGGSFAPYTSLLTTLVPALREAGLPDAAVRQLLVENPARAFAVRRRPAE